MSTIDIFSFLLISCKLNCFVLICVPGLFKRNQVRVLDSNINAKKTMLCTNVSKWFLRDSMAHRSHMVCYGPCATSSPLTVSVWPVTAMVAAVAMVAAIVATTLLVWPLNSPSFPCGPMGKLIAHPCFQSPCNNQISKM